MYIDWNAFFSSVMAFWVVCSIMAAPLANAKYYATTRDTYEEKVEGTMVFWFTIIASPYSIGRAISRLSSD
jgi:hypothetical protein